MNKEKLIPVILPIDPARPEIYRARNGDKITAIFDHSKVVPHQKDYLNVFYNSETSRWLRGDGAWMHSRSDGYDITHQLSEEEQPAPARDWSEVVEKLQKAAYPGDLKMYAGNFTKEALKILQDAELEYRGKFGNEGLTPLEDAVASYQGAMADLDYLIETIAMAYKSQDWDAIQVFMQKNYKKQWQKHWTNALQGNENALPEAPLEFVIGELYEDINNDTYEYLGKNFYNGLCYFINIKSGEVVPVELAIIPKCIPTPKEHEVTVWLNMYDDSQERGGAFYSSKQQANHQRNINGTTIACVPVTLNFRDGDGL